MGRVVRPFTVLRSRRRATIGDAARDGKQPCAVPSRGGDRVPPFETKSVLDPTVVGFFFDRMRTDRRPRRPKGAVMDSAVAHAQAGRFDEAQQDVAVEPDDTPLP